MPKKPITNEYEALTTEAQLIADRFGRAFEEISDGYPYLAVRDLEYLAHAAIHQRAVEIVLKRAVALRKSSVAGIRNHLFAGNGPYCEAPACGLPLMHRIHCPEDPHA